MNTIRRDTPRVLHHSGSQRSECASIEFLLIQAGSPLPSPLVVEVPVTSTSTVITIARLLGMNVYSAYVAHVREATFRKNCIPESTRCVHKKMRRTTLLGPFQLGIYQILTLKDIPAESQQSN